MGLIFFRYIESQWIFFLRFK